MKDSDTPQDQQENAYYEEPSSSSKDFVPFSSNDIKGEKSDKEAGSVKVEHGYVINLPLCNLLKRKVNEVKEHYIVLYEHFVIYKVVGKFESYNDELEIWEDIKYNYRWTRMRKDITDVNMIYDNKEHLWAVSLEFCAKNEENWFYQKGEQAKKLHDILQNYFVTRDQK